MKYEWLNEYLLEKPGTEKDFKLEWGWHRYMVRGKLFAAVCSPRGMKDERYNGRDLVNLKCDPRLAEAFRVQYPEILPGFYCDMRLFPLCGHRHVSLVPCPSRSCPVPLHPYGLGVS